MPSPERILVLSITRMGDIIQSIPFFRRLRIRHPDAEIHVLVERCFADVMSMIPDVDQIHDVRLEDILPNLQSGANGDIREATAYHRGLVETLRAMQFAEVWNLTHTRPSMVLNYLLAADRGQGVTLDRQGLQRVNSPWLEYFFATNLARPWCQFNLVDMYANCVRGVPWDAGRSLQLDVSGVEAILPMTGRTRIAIHPGASQSDKCWPLRSFYDLTASLAMRPDTEIVIVAGPRDVERAHEFESIHGVVNLAGKTSPRDLAALFRDCRLVISNDSGPMHVAAAVGTPVLDITVGSALAAETAPYGEGHVVIEPDIACFPCSPRRPCGDRECGNRIAPDAVLRVAEWMLGWREQPRPHELVGCRVYCTGFSKADGLLALQRVGADRPFERDEINNLMRPLWLAFLESRAVWPSVSSRTDQSFQHRARVARSAAQSASRLAHQLAGAARDNRFTPTLQNLGTLLFDQEQRVQDNLSGDGVLGGLLAFLRIRRGSLGGETVAEQARETAGLYRDTARFLSALTHDPVQEKNYENIHTALHEDAHEDSAQRT